MKIMISQPMNGLSKEQIIKNREEVVRYIESQGDTIIDTVFDFKDMEGVKNKSVYFLSKALEKLASADALFCMEGWELARGCRFERDIARSYGIPLYYQEDLMKNNSRI